MFFYSWERERQSVSRGGAEREGDTDCEAGSRLWAVSTKPAARLKPTSSEVVTWAKVRCWTAWATQAPLYSVCSPFQLRKIQNTRFQELSVLLSMTQLMMSYSHRDPSQRKWSYCDSHTFHRRVRPCSVTPPSSAVGGQRRRGTARPLNTSFI